MGRVFCELNMSISKLCMKIALAVSGLVFSPLAHAGDYVLLDGYGSTRFVQGTVATPEQVCEILNHPIFQVDAQQVPNSAGSQGAVLFPISNAVVKRYLQRVPQSVDFLRVDDPILDQAIKNIQDCLMSLPSDKRERFLNGNFERQLEMPSYQFFRVVLEGDFQQERWSRFVSLIGLAQTHPLLLETMNKTYENISTELARIEAERIRAEEAAKIRAEQERAEQQRMQQAQAENDRLEAKRLREFQAQQAQSQREQLEQERIQVQRDLEMNAYREKLRKEREAAARDQAFYGFIKAILINVALVIAIIGGAFLYFNQSINKEKQGYLREIR